MLEKNIKLFTWFRVLFVTRFYYPVYTILFLDFGLTLEEFSYLNTIWALVIVFMEVPSGALSDTIGHKKLLVITSLLMICELGVLILCPVGRTPWLFPLMLFNRICSGLAEAAASGADEALAYDSLKSLGREKEWPDILARTSRLTSIFMFIAMISGGILYDQKIMGNFINSSDWIIKLPLIVNLLTGMLCLFVALQFVENNKKEKSRKAISLQLRESFDLILNTGQWILKSPIILIVIVLSVSFDHIIRLFLTLGVEYYRIIKIPTSLLGIVGSSMSFIGIFIPTIAAKMVKKFSFIKNMVFVSLILLPTFIVLSYVIPYWGVIVSLMIGSCMFFTGFFTSYYLNENAPEDKRATVLSFKGLVVNLGYGGISVLYALYIKSSKTGLTKDEVFVKGLEAFPWYFLFVCFVAFIGVKYITKRK